MKTRRNHRKTTTGRRKRHVKYRVQTRIHHRKGTVSSGRRHKFFKRGGEPSSYGRYLNNNHSLSIRAASLEQINRDIEEKALLLKNTGKVQQPIELSYPDVDAFVTKINAVYVSGFFGSKCNLTIQKLPQISFSDRSVQGGEKQHPVIQTINNKTVKFYISYNGCNFYIYVNNTLYGQLQITTQKGDVINTEAICSNELLNLIKLHLLAASASQSPT
jgi:hypothetical protein